MRSGEVREEYLKKKAKELPSSSLSRDEDGELRLFYENPCFDETMARVEVFMADGDFSMFPAEVSSTKARITPVEGISFRPVILPIYDKPTWPAVRIQPGGYGLAQRAEWRPILPPKIIEYKEKEDENIA